MVANDAGFTHKSLGGKQKLASMYRFHDRDPVFFRRRFELVWRNGDMLDPNAPGGPSRKCLLRSGGTPIGGQVVDLTADVWLYTWDEPAGG